MNPFHFGSSDRRLFGVFHPPRQGHRPRLGVVLCYPARDEYFLSHRAFRQLATRLAAAGCPCLRFDYYGSGDSFGESHEATIEQWKRDIAIAIDELKGIAGVPRVSLIGLRLGATLAAMSASERLMGDVEDVVLWDPVVSGGRYLDTLAERHSEFLRFLRGRSRAPADGVGAGVEEADGAVGEAAHGVFGFPLTDRFRTELAAVDLTSVDVRVPGRLLVVVGERRLEYEDLVGRFSLAGADVAFEHIPGVRIWEKDALWSRELVPARVVHRIASWLT